MIRYRNLTSQWFKQTGDGEWVKLNLPNNCTFHMLKEHEMVSNLVWESRGSYLGFPVDIYSTGKVDVVLKGSRVITKALIVDTTTHPLDCPCDAHYNTPYDNDYDDDRYDDDQYDEDCEECDDDDDF